LVREGEGIAAGVLESLGVSLAKVRAQVIDVLKSSSGFIASPRDEGMEPPEERLPTGALNFPGRLSRWFQGRLPAQAPYDLTPGGDEAGSLDAWMRVNLNFGLLSLIDVSFLTTLRNAMPIAGMLHHNYLGTDHLLAVMLCDSESAAFRLLREVNADLNAIFTILNMGVGTISADMFTHEAMRAIQLAIEEATAAGQLPATADHLLLGIILEGRNTGAVALLKAGITAERVRSVIREARS
jgi:hypothetical protein